MLYLRVLFLAVVGYSGVTTGKFATLDDGVEGRRKELKKRSKRREYSG